MCENILKLEITIIFRDTFILWIISDVKVNDNFHKRQTMSIGKIQSQYSLSMSKQSDGKGKIISYLTLIWTAAIYMLLWGNKK